MSSRADLFSTHFHPPTPVPSLARILRFFSLGFLFSSVLLYFQCSIIEYSLTMLGFASRFIFHLFSSISPVTWVEHCSFLCLGFLFSSVFLFFSMFYHILLFRKGWIRVLIYFPLIFIFSHLLPDRILLLSSSWFCLFHWFQFSMFYRISPLRNTSWVLVLTFFIFSHLLPEYSIILSFLFVFYFFLVSVFPFYEWLSLLPSLFSIIFTFSHLSPGQNRYFHSLCFNLLSFSFFLSFWVRFCHIVDHSLEMVAITSFFSFYFNFITG